MRRRRLVRGCGEIVLATSLVLGAGRALAGDCTVNPVCVLDHTGVTNAPCIPKPAPGLSRDVFHDSNGAVFEGGAPSTAIMALSRYRAPKGVAEVSEVIKKLRRRAVPTELDRRALQTMWSQWASRLPAFAAFTCDGPALQRLKAATLSRQRAECDAVGFRGMASRAECAWLTEVLSAANEGLKPVGEAGVLAPNSACATLESLKEGLDPAQNTELATQAKLLGKVDEVLANPGSLGLDAVTGLQIFEQRSEFHTSCDVAYLSVPFNHDSTRVNPAYDLPTYVRIENYDLSLDVDVEWKAEFEDPARSVKTVAGFLGFVIASYGRQSLDPTWLSGTTAGPAEKSGSWGGARLELAPASPVSGRWTQAQIVQEALLRLPPVHSIGTRYVGPIKPEPDTRYTLTLRERQPETGKKSTLGLTQTVEYLPRANWKVTVSAGVSADVFISELDGSSPDNDPTRSHEWKPLEVGASSTSFSRESAQVWERHVTPFIALLISPPWRCLNHDAGRVMGQFSVGLPLNQPRGVAQFGAGLAWWWRSGVTLALSGVVRVYDQPIAAVGPAQLVLPNEGGKSPVPPSIGTRDAVAGGLSLSLGFDLAIVGEAFLGAGRSLFTGGAK